MCAEYFFFSVYSLNKRLLLRRVTCSEIFNFSLLLSIRSLQIGFLLPLFDYIVQRRSFSLYLFFSLQQTRRMKATNSDSEIYPNEEETVLRGPSSPLVLLAITRSLESARTCI